MLARRSAVEQPAYALQRLRPRAAKPAELDAGSQVGYVQTTITHPTDADDTVGSQDGQSIFRFTEHERNTVFVGDPFAIRQSFAENECFPAAFCQLLNSGELGFDIAHDHHLDRDARNLAPRRVGFAPLFAQTFAGHGLQ